ncbi:MAG: PKD domain-containing protein [Bacteroidales bacterium]|jgi:photosystem II stability/assembly factor-like uncharacterized protein|nr:PKD domain-containing protein [Bacteroidales bacterium]
MNKGSNIYRVLGFFFLLTACAPLLHGQIWLEKLKLDSKSATDFFEVRKAAEEHFRHQKKEYFARKFDISDNPELNYRSIRGYIEFKRWEEYWQNHVDSKGSPISPLKEYAEYRSFVESGAKGAEAEWININRTSAPGGYWGMGRIREIAFHPDDPDTFWAGADQGGIWKTTDNGLSYIPVADDLPFLKVSSICVNHEDPDIIYMSGGGTDGGWWDRTIGVYKTRDGGRSWEATGLSAHLSDYESYRRLAMSPDDPDLLLVTGREGIYRTADGGATWSKRAGGDHYDLVFKPDNGNIVFAGSGGNIKRSTDGGLSWMTVTNNHYGGYMRNIAISPVNSSYMTAELDVWFNDVRASIIYASRDGGESWTEQSSMTNDPGGTIAFSSNDTLTLYRGWTKIFKSTDLGKTWTQITNWYNNNVHDEVHADHFRIKKNPLVDDRLYFCNDGGVYIYEEDRDEWIERSAGLIISQYYSISSSQSDPVVLLSGSQDNGGWYRNSNGYWRTTNGGDGMHTWQHPTNNSIGLSSYPGGKLYRTSNTWVSFTAIHTNIDPEPVSGDWNSRYAVDPNNNNIIVTGCYPDIFRSDDMGSSWKKIGDNLAGGNNFHCVVIPEANAGYIYASAENRIYKTTDTGNSWHSWAPSPEKIKGIAVSPYNADHVWIVTGGYSAGVKVFRSYNGGMTWENISGSLPNLPALSIIYEKGTNDGIYIGMTYGIYYRNNTMDDWVFYGHDIPNCEIRHLDIQYESAKIRCATYGRGIYEADLYPLDIDSPEAFFEMSSKNICLDDSIIFFNKSVNADRIIWDFGDGNTATSDTISYVYDRPGTYNAKLTAFNDQRADTHQEREIRVESYIDPLRIGPPDQSMGSKDVYSGDGAGIIFNAGFPLILKSFVTYAATTGTRTLKLTDSKGNILFTREIALKAGRNFVTLDLEIEQGDDYALTFEGNTFLLMNTKGASYPYNKYDLFSITANTSFEPDSYYFFYDLVVQYMCCDPAFLPPVDESTNIALDNILVYPNPVLYEFSVEIRGFQPEEELSLRIISLTGDVIYRENISTRRKLQLRKSDLGISHGIYIIEVTGSSSSSSSRIVRM